MREFLHRKLTNDELQAREDMRYEGRIVRVEPHRVFNKFKFTSKEIVPVIVFEDGWEWIPNLGARKALMDAWGPETDDWFGRCMAIYLKAVTRTEKESGRAVERLEKHVEPLPDDAIW